MFTYPTLLISYVYVYTVLYIIYCIFIHVSLATLNYATLFTYPTLLISYVQWDKIVFSQPPIVKGFPLKKMREACNFHHRYTSTMTDKIRKKFQKITL
jgi:hypothetical protein